MPTFAIALLLLSANPQAPVRATVESIHDGDTLRLTIHLPFGVDLPAREVRAAGYDAWEIDRRRRTVKVTDAEIAKGKEAREYLSQLLAVGGCWVEDTGQRDPYGRLSVSLWGRNKNGGDWIDVAEEMRDAGYDRRAK